MVPHGRDLIMHLSEKVQFDHIIALVIGFLVGAEWSETSDMIIEYAPMEELELEAVFIYRNQDAFTSWVVGGWNAEYADGCIHLLQNGEGQLTFVVEPGSDTETHIRKFTRVFGVSDDGLQ